MKRSSISLGPETHHEVIAKNGPPHVPTGHDMMQDTWSIQAGGTSYDNKFRKGHKRRHVPLDVNKENRVKFQ